MLSSVRQSAEQPSPSSVLPSSQASPGSRTPSPHGGVQSAGQPSPERVLPSSQASPGSSLPLPQVKRIHVFASPMSAHRSPGGHMPPLPQFSDSTCRQPACKPIIHTMSRIQPAHGGRTRELCRGFMAAPRKRTGRGKIVGSTQMSPRRYFPLQPRSVPITTGTIAQCCLQNTTVHVEQMHYKELITMHTGHHRQNPQFIEMVAPPRVGVTTGSARGESSCTCG